MPRFSGMDLEEIERLSKTLHVESGRIEREANAMTATLENLPWVGNDQKRFLEVWRSRHLPALMNAAKGFETASREAHQHVRRQQGASSR